MTTPWRPEIEMSAKVVQALLVDQCPQLLGGQLIRVDAGWNHTIWRSGDHVFRFPHRRDCLDHAAQRALRQQRLAELLSTPNAPQIPLPVHVGTATSDYPGQFVAYRWIEGVSPSALELTTGDRAATAEPLAHTLRLLHTLDADTAAAWGVEQRDRTDELNTRTQMAQQRKEQLKDTAYGAIAGQAADAMRQGPAPGTTAAVTHGDLHDGQLLFDPGSHHLTGIIDWDEVCISDPAFDLMVAYAVIPAAARPRFWTAYGHPMDAETKGRAQFVALSFGLALLAQGVVDGNPGLARNAAQSIRCALEP